MNFFATFIVPNGVRTAALAKMNAKDANGAFLHPGLPGMFTTPLIGKASADTAPTTAWISSGWMSAAEIAYCNAQLPGPFDYSDGTFDTVIDGKATRISEDSHAYMARNGYRMKPGTI